MDAQENADNLRPASPTTIAYQAMTQAYSFFNRRLFDDGLPFCLITFQRKSGTYGYFAPQRFGSMDGGQVTDEIAMNPSHFKSRATEQVLSTLVHEQAHLWQQHYGKPSRTGYHNKEWADKMRDIGLIPSSTGAEGGKETGQKMSHYIEQGGKFSVACAALLDSGFTLPYVELWDEAKAKKNAERNKTKFTCVVCGVNAWGKPDLHIIHADCGEVMVSTDTGESNEDTAPTPLHPNNNPHKKSAKPPAAM